MPANDGCRRIAVVVLGIGGVAVPTVGSLLAADAPLLDVGGRLAHTVVWTEDDDGERLENVSVLGTRVNSYIWQPWFTSVSAEGNLGYRTEDGDRNRDRSDLFLSGGLSLGILPYSDFPTFLSYRRTERYAEIDDIDNDSTGDFYSLNSRMALPGNINLSTVAAYADIEDDSEDSVTRDLTVTATRPFDIQSVLLSYSHREEEIDDRQDRSDEDSRLDALRLEHQIAPTRNVTVNSGATLLTAEETFGQRDEDTDQIQAFSVAQWRPASQRLLVNGAIRALTERIDRSILAASQEEENITLSGSLGGVYTIMPRLDATLNTASTYDRQLIEASSGVETEAEIATVTTNAGLRYASLPRPLFGADYQWNLSNTVGYIYVDQDVSIDFDDINDPFDDAFDDDDDFDDLDDDDDAATGPTAQIVGSHNLSKSLQPAVLDPLRVTFGQTVRGTHQSDDDDVLELTHSLRLSHSRSRGRRYLSAALSLTDSREFGDEEDELQVASALLNSRFSFNRYQSLNGSVSAQLARRVDDFTSDERIRGSALGSLQYRHDDLFDVERLRFTSTFLLRAVFLDNRDLYDDDNEARWTNRLDYLIGQLTLRLESRTSYRDDDEWAERVLFSLSRGF
ncbi:MAG: hypothetical protein OEU92_02895 [Alphaproteobacteria bacterium]|nr:hypothetical protein [Alphaproteobacteria bacterium]